MTSAERGGATGAGRFGRVADDGTVYLRLPDGGERPVGSWQAGPAEEGLALFARRFDDLATEVELVGQRLAAGSLEPAGAVAALDRLATVLPEAAVVGDLAALSARIGEVRARAEADRAARIAAARAERAAQAERAAEVKRQWAAEAEELAEHATGWKVAGERIGQIMREWRTVPGLDRRTDQELWRRVAAARAAFNRRRGAHFAQLDAARKEAQEVKERLVTEAEALAGSTDWGPTAARLKDLMTRWKGADRAARDVEDDLWRRFRAAQDAFFTARSAAFAARDARQHEAERQRVAVIEAIERLDLADPLTAQDRLRDLLRDYERAGRVSREAEGALDTRLRAAEQRVRTAVQARWRQDAANTNPLLGQVREQVAKAERQLQRAREAGDHSRIADAEEALRTRRAFLAQAERSSG